MKSATRYPQRVIDMCVESVLECVSAYLRVLLRKAAGIDHEVPCTWETQKQSVVWTSGARSGVLIEREDDLLVFVLDVASFRFDRVHEHLGIFSASQSYHSNKAAHLVQCTKPSVRCASMHAKLSFVPGKRIKDALKLGRHAVFCSSFDHIRWHDDSSWLVLLRTMQGGLQTRWRLE